MEPLRPKVVRSEPVPATIDRSPTDRRPRTPPLARIRVPLTLTVQPWATLYRLPDGRLWWCLRLREDGTVRTRLVSTATLRGYARTNRLRRMEEDLVKALARAGAPDAVPG